MAVGVPAASMGHSTEFRSRVTFSRDGKWDPPDVRSLKFETGGCAVGKRCRRRTPKWSVPALDLCSGDGLDPRIVPNPAGAVILLTTTERGKDLQKTFPYHPRSKSFWKYGRLSSGTRE